MPLLLASVATAPLEEVHGHDRRTLRSAVWNLSDPSILTKGQVRSNDDSRLIPSRGFGARARVGTRPCIGLRGIPSIGSPTFSGQCNLPHGNRWALGVRRVTISNSHQCLSSSTASRSRERRASRGSRPVRGLPRPSFVSYEPSPGVRSRL